MQKQQVNHQDGAQIGIQTIDLSFGIIKILLVII